MSSRCPSLTFILTARLSPHTYPLHTIRPPPIRHFHSTSRQRLPTHYDTLNLSPTCTQAEVKARFYALSKTHHPDRNRNDPSAAKRFVAISEAYATIGNATKRQKYDRDVLDLHQSSSSSSSSSSSTSTSRSSHSGPAGGRKASGLSRRRGQFRGPPPSFYRAGGWGSQSAKREQYAQSGHSGTREESGSSAYPFASTDVNDVPHFDRDGHYRTQTTLEEQLHASRAKRRVRMDRGAAGARSDAGPMPGPGHGSADVKGDGKQRYGYGSSSASHSGGIWSDFDPSARRAGTAGARDGDERMYGYYDDGDATSTSTSGLGGFVLVSGVLVLAMGSAGLILSGWGGEAEKTKKTRRDEVLKEKG